MCAWRDQTLLLPECRLYDIETKNGRKLDDNRLLLIAGGVWNCLGILEYVSLYRLSGITAIQLLPRRRLIIQSIGLENWN